MVVREYESVCRGTDGTRGVGTLDPLLMGPFPGPVGRPSMDNPQRATSIPTYIHCFLDQELKK